MSKFNYHPHESAVKRGALRKRSDLNLDETVTNKKARKPVLIETQNSISRPENTHDSSAIEGLIGLRSSLPDEDKNGMLAGAVENKDAELALHERKVVPRLVTPEEYSPPPATINALSKSHTLPDGIGRFLLQTYQMMSKCSENIGGWTNEGGMIIVRDIKRFTEEVIPNYFSHKNFGTFNRQLNYYGFQKVQDFDKGNEKYVMFCHENFKRDQPGLLRNITRSTNGGGKLGNAQREIQQVKADNQKIKEKMAKKDKEIEQINEQMAKQDREIEQLKRQVAQIIQQAGEINRIKEEKEHFI